MAIIKKLGVDRIWKHVERIRNHFVNTALSLGFEPYSPLEKTLGPTVSLHIGDRAHDVEIWLRQHKVITSARGPGLRFAHHFFNTKDDVEKALTMWRKALKYTR
jgi:selenocysteine lyase/cysteine desulfurase